MAALVTLFQTLGATLNLEYHFYDFCVQILGKLFLEIIVLLTKKLLNLEVRPTFINSLFLSTKYP